MNERIQKLAEQSTSIVEMVGPQGYTSSYANFDKEKFAQLLVSDVLREVDTRAYVSGDRAWSDEVDRPWIELEYGFGPLAEAQHQAGKKK
jgi:hypothetical protein